MMHHFVMRSIVIAVKMVETFYFMDNFSEFILSSTKQKCINNYNSNYKILIIKQTNVYLLYTKINKYTLIYYLSKFLGVKSQSKRVKIQSFF